MSDQKLPLVIIGGPTAVGKSKEAVILAGKIGGEVISADSMQVYRRMDIGTAKVTKEEMGGIPHHLIDILDPDEPFNIARFTELARESIRDIHSRGRIPLLVGGTSFYIHAVLYGTSFSEEDDDMSIRSSLEAFAAGEGKEALHAMLSKIDPDAAKAIPPGNVKRVIRAIEYYRKTGEPISVHNERERSKEAVYNAAWFALTDSRQLIYRRIDERVDEMIRDGLVEEVRGLVSEGIDKNAVSMQGIGYRQLFDYLEGQEDLDTAIGRIKTETRHFAKRQLTWLRREKDVIWLDRSLFPVEKLREEMIKELIRRRIIPA